MKLASKPLCLVLTTILCLCAPVHVKAELSANEYQKLVSESCFENLNACAGAHAKVIDYLKGLGLNPDQVTDVVAGFVGDESTAVALEVFIEAAQGASAGVDNEVQQPSSADETGSDEDAPAYPEPERTPVPVDSIAGKKPISSLVPQPSPSGDTGTRNPDPVPSGSQASPKSSPVYGESQETIFEVTAPSYTSNDPGYTW